MEPLKVINLALIKIVIGRLRLMIYLLAITFFELFLLPDNKHGAN